MDLTPELAGALQTAAAVAVTYISAEWVKWAKTRKTRKDIIVNVDAIMEGVGKNTESIKAIKSDLTVIKSELSFNSGKSLKDMVYRIAGETEAFFAIKMNADDVPIYVCDSEGQCTFANTQLCNLFGLDYNQMLGYGWLSAVGKTQHEKDSTYDDWREAIKKDIPYVTEYTVVNQKTGEEIPVKTRAIPVRGKKGEILFYKGEVEKKLNN